jgi:hypothetical protein
MIVEFEEAQIQGSLQTRPGMQVDIGNVEVVTSILADRLYNDKVRIVLQEYACNARDAHREIGRPDLPIEIDLPGKLDPVLRIRDFGPGMDPERVNNVFRRLGNSTKRDDNTQTGGFGIGAKCGFAYHTRTFTVVTRVDGVQYTYHCYRAGTGRFMIDPIGEHPTDAPNGTEIQIPVAENDIREFRSDAAWLFEDWVVRPVFNIQPDFHGAPDSIADPAGRWEMRRARYDRTVIASVDGIPYDTRLSYASERFGGRSLILRFDCGELTLAANRESLESTPGNEALIKQRLAEAQQEFRVVAAQQFFNPALPLFSQINGEALAALLKLKLVELPPGMTYPVQYGAFNVETCLCTAAWSYRKRNPGPVLRDWEVVPVSSRVLRTAYIFSAAMSIEKMKQYIRENTQRPNGRRDVCVMAVRLRPDSDLVELQRYHDLSEVIDLPPEPRKPRSAQPKGRVTVSMRRGGRTINCRMFPEQLAAKYWTTYSVVDGFAVGLPDGRTVHMTPGTYCHVHRDLQLPAVDLLILDPTDRIKRLTAGPLTFSAQRYGELIEQTRHSRTAKIAEDLRRRLQRTNHSWWLLKEMLRRCDPEAHRLLTMEQVSYDKKQLLPFMVADEPEDFTRVAQLAFRINRVVAQTFALRDCLTTHLSDRTDPSVSQFMDLIYHTYFEKELTK